MSPARLLSRVLVVPVAATAAALVPGLAHAAPANCTFSVGNVAVTMAGEGATLSRDPDGTIRLTRDLGGPVTCGTTAATVFSASVVTVGGSGGTLRLDLSGGGFVPGAGGETDGLSELEFAWNATGTALEILGSTDPTWGDFLARSADGGYHLNADADRDLAVNQQPASVVINGRQGDDFVDTSRGFTNTNQVHAVRIDGGDGNDVLRGDAGDDDVTGGPGADEITAGAGSDGAVAGDAGDDVLHAAKAHAEPAFDAPVAVPDAGSATSRVHVSGLDYAQDAEVRLTLTHPDTSTLKVELLPRGQVAQPLVLADARSGLGFFGTLFDDSAATPIDAAPAGATTFAARYRPQGGALAPFLTGSAAGEWELRVTDGATDGKSGTIQSWSLHLVGSKLGESGTRDGNESYDGGAGADTVRYATRLERVTVTAATAVSGTAGELGESDTYAAVETVETGLGHDWFAGSAEADTFLGGGGSDTFHPGPGDDKLVCGDEHDLDTLDYSALAAGVDVDLGAGTAAAEGLDTLVGCDAVIGTDHDDVIRGTASYNVLRGGAGGDQLFGEGGFDELFDGTGSDLVDGGSGAGDYVYAAGDGYPDTYDGGAGASDRFFAAGTTGVTVTLDGLADDGMPGEHDDVRAGFEAVKGTDHADSITGSDGPDEILGEGGADTVDGAGGDDLLGGGDGADTLSFASSGTGVVASLATGLATGDGSDTTFEFENLRGTHRPDTLAGNDAANVVTPGHGWDVVDTAGGDDRLVAEATIDGADVWTAGSGVDTADYSARSEALDITVDGAANDGYDGEGDDVGLDVESVAGGSGDDYMVGGLEPNDFRGGYGDDLLLGRGGNDTLRGGDGADEVNGSSGDDTLYGDAGADAVSGGEGDDRLFGGVGGDTLSGGLGDDDEYGESGDDRFAQGDTATANGSDLLIGGADRDTVSYAGRSGGVAVDLDGRYDDGQALEQDNAFAEVVEGTAYADTLTGSAAADTIRGLGGNDRITGLGGTDALDGGTGNDTFAEGAAATGADVFTGGAGTDVVDYGARAGAVRVDLDNAADDGATAGEADNVRSDVENVTGGAGADTITGSAAANRLAGGGGNDTMTGGAGSDTLDGGAGNDTLYARDAVRDSVLGGTGTDRVRRDAVDVVSGVESVF